MRIKIFPVVIFTLLLQLMQVSQAENAIILDSDPHKNKLGFFDIHICNWPDRQRFFKILFSTEKFNDVVEMEVFDPTGASLSILQKNRFRKILRKNKPEKHVFIVDMDVPENATTGWYSINVKTSDGKEYVARDFVPMTRIHRVAGMAPSSEEDSFPLPVALTWNKVPGAAFYRVYIKDVWTGEMMYTSKLVSDNSINIPKDKLSPGGYYSWSVHARDTNEHILLGDFHMGSMSEKAFFNVAD